MYTRVQPPIPYTLPARFHPGFFPPAYLPPLAIPESAIPGSQVPMYGLGLLPHEVAALVLMQQKRRQAAATGEPPAKQPGLLERMRLARQQRASMRTPAKPGIPPVVETPPSVETAIPAPAKPSISLWEKIRQRRESTMEAAPGPTTAPVSPSIETSTWEPAPAASNLSTTSPTERAPTADIPPKKVSPWLLFGGLAAAAGGAYLMFQQ